MTYTTKVRFDDGDTLVEHVWTVDGSLLGGIWTDGEACGYQARAISNIAGYWMKDTMRFETREAAVNGLLAQAKFERGGNLHNPSGDK